MNINEKYYRTRRRGLLATFFCLIIVPILFVTLVTSYNFREYASKQAEMAVIRQSEHQDDIITRYLNQQITLLTTLVGMHPIDIMGEQEQLDELFRAVSERENIVDLHVIDSTGNQLAYVGPYRDSIIGKNYKDSTWFQEALVSGKHVSDVFMGYRNIPHFVIAVTDPLKTYVFRATINSEIFNSLLHEAQNGPEGDAFIINRRFEFQTPSLQGVKTLTTEERMLVEYHDETIVKKIGPYFYTTVWLKEGQWMLIIKSKISDSLGSFTNKLKESHTIIAIASIIFLILATVHGQFIVKKIERNLRTRENLDHQMIQVEKMAAVGRLAAGIAHEINNPLQMITNQAGWIEELLPEEDPEKIKNFEEYTNSVKKIKIHVKRAGTITQRLLIFSRKMTAEKECVKVNDLIEETVSFIENEIVSNNILLNKDLAENVPPTMTDGPQLQQVFLNLLNNGLDAVEKDGHINIRTSVHNNTIFIEFADSGSGISPEVMQHIYDPFFTTKAPGKGTGLGMSICYDIMHKLGGKIDVKNDEKGGAVVTLSLPVKKMGDAGRGEDMQPVEEN